MSGGRSDTPFETFSLDPCHGPSSAAPGSVRGDYSGNVGDNIYGSHNTIYNYGCGSTSPDPDEILQCLYTSEYEWHRNRVREPVQGTCAWVTEHTKYRDWLEKKTSGLLWLSADPGCGKSVIASFLVEHLQRQLDAIVCYFFFKDDSDEQGSAKFALCAILHQIFKGREHLIKFAEKEFKAKGSKLTKEVDTLWNILVKVVAEGGCGDVVCVIDALDECEKVTQARLIRHLTSLAKSQNSHIRLKLLVTSRPYHNIERELGSPATTIRLKGEEEVNSITADVNRVIDEGIETLESYWGRPGGLGYLRNYLESSADRTFLWVSLVLEILKDSEDDSREQFTNIVFTTPRDLSELYNKILDKSTSHDKARRILNIVVAATRPLTLQEMNVAFRIRREHSSIKDLEDLHGGFEKTVKNSCGLFVRVVDSKIYLVHQTARQFLLQRSSPAQGDWQHTLCPKDSNFTMADICFSYLSLKEFENDPLEMDTHGYVAKEAVDSYLQKHPFLEYAARHWTDHFRASRDRQTELIQLTRLICEAGSKRFLTWLQVYWFNARRGYRCPKDLTHLMIATWFGQESVVERLLNEEGDINARSKRYGTALNIAAIQKNENLTIMLLHRNVRAYIRGKEYNILDTKRSELVHHISDKRDKEDTKWDDGEDEDLEEDSGDEWDDDSIALKKEKLERKKEVKKEWLKKSLEFEEPEDEDDDDSGSDWYDSDPDEESPESRSESEVIEFLVSESLIRSSRHSH